MYLIYMYKEDLALNGWYAIKPNQTNNNPKWSIITWSYGP